LAAVKERGIMTPWHGFVLIFEWTLAIVSGVSLAITVILGVISIAEAIKDALRWD
jgi:hypothetical protein